MEQADRLEVTTAKPRSFTIVRFLSVASLAAILVAASLLMLTYRQVAVAHLVELSELDASTLAVSLFNSVRREFMGYLNDEAVHHLQLPPEALIDAIGDLTRDTPVSDVRVLDDEGIVVFSTKAGEIGRALATNPDAARALEGTVVGRLVTRNGFWPLVSTSEDSQLQSYVPIQAGRSGPVLGLFAIDTDVTPLLAKIERTQFEVFVASALIMVALYGLVLAMARYADWLAQRSEETLRERSHSLALLSQQLISAQESDKQRIAYELHEGISQTMFALKMQIEGLCNGVGRRSVPCARLRKTLVPVIQDMAKGARTLAEDLYPPSLSDFGVLRTLDWYFREMGRAHPSLQVEWVTSVTEDRIAKSLKTPLFRLVEDVTKYLVREGNTHRMSVQLSKAPDRIVLKIADDGSITGLDASKQVERRRHLAALLERIRISGGDGRTYSTPWGGTRLHAEWPD